MENISKTFMTIQITMFPCDLSNIQKFSLSNVHSLMWLFWLCFYPKVVNLIYHGGCHLEILKKYPIKSMWMRAKGKILKTCSSCTNILKNKNKSISKGIIMDYVFKFWPFKCS